MDQNTSHAVLVVVILFILLRQRKTAPPTSDPTSPSPPPPPDQSSPSEDPYTPPPPPVYTPPPAPPPVPPPKQWLNSAKGYRAGSSKKLPLIYYYFPDLDIVAEQIGEELQDNQLPTKLPAIKYGAMLGWEMLGMPTAGEIKSDLSASLKHLKSDIQSGKMTHPYPFF